MDKKSFTDFKPETLSLYIYIFHYQNLIILFFTVFVTNNQSIDQESERLTSFCSPNLQFLLNHWIILETFSHSARANTQHFKTVLLYKIITFLMEESLHFI